MFCRVGGISPLVRDTLKVCKWQSCHLPGWSKATLPGTCASRTCWLRSVRKRRSVTSSWYRLGGHGIEPLGAGLNREPVLDSHLSGLHSLITIAQSLYEAQDGCAFISSLHNGRKCRCVIHFYLCQGFWQQDLCFTRRNSMMIGFHNRANWLQCYHQKNKF